MILAHQVDRQVGEVEIIQRHIADVIIVGDFFLVLVAVAVRVGFRAVAYFHLHTLRQGVLLLKEHGKIALYLVQLEYAVVQGR